MNDLSQQRCAPCEGGMLPLNEAETGAMLEKTPNWSLCKGGREIVRVFSFKDYGRTMAFVNAVAWIAHREDHHPEMEVSYNQCIVRFSTHAVGGLSENDFICAAHIDGMAGPKPGEATPSAAH